MSKLHLPCHKATAATRWVSLVGNPGKMVRQVPSVAVVAGGGGGTCVAAAREMVSTEPCPARTAQPDMTIVKCEYLSPAQHRGTQPQACRASLVWRLSHLLLDSPRKETLKGQIISKIYVSKSDLVWNYSHTSAWEILPSALHQGLLSGHCIVSHNKTSQKFHN